MRWILSVMGISIALMLGFYTANISPAPTSDVVIIPKNQIAMPASVANYEWYPVLKVVDGDTLTIFKDGRSVTLRLIGLDTPETVDPRKTVQCFGREASLTAKQILTGTSVRIEADFSQGELDKYGRTLAYVFLRNGTLWNKYMIAEGYGHEYTYSLPYKYQKEFKDAERKARKEKKGLWADDACANESASPVRKIISQPTLNGTYECSKNTYNCSGFTTQREAQSIFDSCGGIHNDIHKLDSDGDGKVCESLP